MIPIVINIYVYFNKTSLIEFNTCKLIFQKFKSKLKMKNDCNCQIHINFHEIIYREVFQDIFGCNISCIRQKKAWKYKEIPCSNLS